MNCNDCQSALPDLLLDPTAPGNTAARTHLLSCAPCHREFTSLQSTFDLLDLWEAPEPSPYFDQKLAVRLREEQAMPPAGWFERLRARVLFNTGRQFRPALVGALALAIIVGGGTVASVSVVQSGQSIHAVPASATVNDLQTLDKNVQVLQTMDQLLQEESTSEEPATTPLT